MTATTTRATGLCLRLPAMHAAAAVLTSDTSTVAWLNGLSLTATFDGEFSEVTRSYAGKGLVRYAW